MSRRQRLCIVAPVHVWDDVRVFHKEAVTLAAAGYDVELLAQAPGTFVADGVKVSRVWAPRTPRLLRFLAFPAVFVQALVRWADVYHLHNPDTLPLCCMLKLFRRRVIYDAHEDFSKRIGVREWIPQVLRGMVAKLVSGGERVAAWTADGVIASQSGTAARLGAKAVVIGNPPRVDIELVARVKARACALSWRRNDAFNAVYVGLVSETRGLIEMIEAVDWVNRQHAARLRIIGPAVSGALEQAQLLPGWRYVEYLDRMPQEDAFAYIAASDVGLAVLHDIADYAEADPNKLYEYMVFGKPFIASAFPLWQARLNGVDAGWFVSPGDVQALVEALLLAMDPDTRRCKGEAGAEFVRGYNWEVESAKLLALYRGILGADVRVPAV